MNFTEQSTLRQSPTTIICAAFLIGVTGDLLLRAVPWGLNLFLWTLAAVAAAILLMSRAESDRLGSIRVPASGMVLFAALFMWRDSGYLHFLNAVGYLTCMSIALYAAREIRPAPDTLTRYFQAFTRTVQIAVAGAIVFLSVVDWDDVRQRGTRRHLIPAIRGVLFSLPLLVVIATLFRSADPVFARWVDTVFGVNLPLVLEHLILTLLIGWAALGILFHCLRPSPEESAENETAKLGMGGIEASVVVTAVSALFFVFVLVQLGYLFGGREHVLQSAGVTFAEYARQGFFELVSIAAFVLGLILLLHWLVRDEPVVLRRRFDRIAGGLVILVFVIIASALDRMYLYQSVYGLTELRFFTTSFIIWLAFVFAWMGATVLQDRRSRFAKGMVYSGFAAIIMLNALNPDAIIARTNIERAESGHSVDAEYLAYHLSADAAPMLIDAVENERVQPVGKLASGILEHWDRAAADLRTFNWSRHRARELTRRHRSVLTVAAEAEGSTQAEPGGTDGPKGESAPEPEAGIDSSDAEPPTMRTANEAGVSEHRGCSVCQDIRASASFLGPPGCVCYWERTM